MFDLTILINYFDLAFVLRERKTFAQKRKLFRNLDRCQELRLNFRQIMPSTQFSTFRRDIYQVKPLLNDRKLYQIRARWPTLRIRLKHCFCKLKQISRIRRLDLLNFSLDNRLKKFLHRISSKRRFQSNHLIEHTA